MTCGEKQKDKRASLSSFCFVFSIVHFFSLPRQELLECCLNWMLCVWVCA